MLLGSNQEIASKQIRDYIKEKPYTNALENGPNVSYMLVEKIGRNVSFVSH